MLRPAQIELNRLNINIGSSFCLFTAFRGSRLGAGWDLVVWRAIVLAMRLEAFVAVVAIGVVIVSVLRSELMHLLRTCSELIWTIVSTHWH